MEPAGPSARLAEAFAMAHEAHAGQFRKQSTIPYLGHVLSVAGTVIDHGGDEDQVIAALLHDVVEDGGGRPRLDDIRRRFGDRVADIVAACSDSLAEDPDAKPPWWHRKVTYLHHVSSAGHDVALVSAADKLHNARSVLTDYREIREELWTRFNPDAGRPGTLWYYRRVSHVLAERLPPHGPAQRLGRELQTTVALVLDEVTAQHGEDVIARDWSDARAREQAVLAELALG